MRSRYYYRPDHPKANERGFVSADDLGSDAIDPQRALDAPIMVGRFYEGAHHTDGTDLGSRAKHREFMRQNGLAVASDYKETWEKKQKEREAFYTPGSGHGSKERREDVARAVYELSKKERR